MKKNKKILFLLYLCFLWVVSSCITTKTAQKDFNNAEYSDAIFKYKKLLKKADSKTNFLLAESYRKSNQIWKAEKYYEDAIINGYKDEIAYYYYLITLKTNNNFDKADSLINKYLSISQNEDVLRLIKFEAQNIKNLRLYPDSSYYAVKNLKSINTEFAEYSPAYSKGKLYFVSNRSLDKIYKGTGTPFTDIYEVKTKGANVNLETLNKLDESINENEINEGSITFSNDGMYMIFAKGNDGKSSGRNSVDLYYSRFRGKEWTKPRLLNVSTSRSWDSTPSLTKDGKTLYFSSNRTKGGFGGTDIYKANVNSRGRWINIQNLGPEINTPGNELFPSVSQDGRLFFSSDNHEGFGGLDILVATRQGGKITISNPGKPLNSRGDDFGINLFNPTRGFFTSNRDGGQGDDDIYTFINNDPNLKIVNYTLKGTTLTPKDQTNFSILGNSVVKLLDKDENIIEETFTDEKGAFSFTVFSDEEYVLIGEKENYFSSRSGFSTIGKAIDKSALKEFITNVDFEKNIILDQIILDKSILLDNIYYDLNKSDIRTDAAIELDKLVIIMRDNPTISIELSSHTDDRSSPEYNQDLSQRRAESAVLYIISKGIDKKRITAKGYGESQLIIVNAKTEEEHQVNRRTEFKVTSYELIDDDEDSQTEERFFINN